MARGPDGLQAPARASNLFAIGKPVVGGKIGIDAFSAACQPCGGETLHRGAATVIMGAKSKNLCAGRF